MSRATKRKHVQLETLQDDFSPPTENQHVVRILSSRGNNLHEVQLADGSTYLVSMPNKFRKNVWVKRGDFVLVEPIEEGDKVKAEICRILTNQHIKYFKKDNVWPKEFLDEEDRKSEDDSEDDIFVNKNRPNFNDEDSCESSDNSECEDSQDSNDERQCLEKGSNVE